MNYSSAKKHMFRYKEKIFIFIIHILFIPFITISTVSAQDVIAGKGMVASAHPLASAAGLEMLKAGGNAIDAAVATAFALAVLEPNASGLGGGGFMVIMLADSGKVVSIDYRETAPLAAAPAFYYNHKQKFNELTRNGPYAIGTPGVVAGLGMALEKYGQLSFCEVIKPAQRYAREGFEVSEKFSDMIFQAYELIAGNPQTAAIYLKEGLPPATGDSLRNPDLADTFKKIAIGGEDLFYRGQIASKIDAEIRQQNGLISIRDLNDYQPLLKEPVHGTYRQYEILSSAPPAGGGTHLIELLNILEGFDVSNLEHNSADYLHLLAESMKICLADKELNMADPAFYKVAVDKLTDKKYALNLHRYIDPHVAGFHYTPVKMTVRESESTTHLSVVDQQGNMVALTQSINYWFGSGITVAGTGILLNNQLADFAPVSGFPNSIEPRKRPVSSMAPTILLKDGRPFMTIGTPGGSRIIGALAQIILNIVDFHMNIDEAIEAPRIHAFKEILHVEGRISEAVIEDLKRRGHDIKIYQNYDNYFGGAQGILINPQTGKLHGGADSRRDGVAIGY